MAACIDLPGKRGLAATACARGGAAACVRAKETGTVPNKRMAPIAALMMLTACGEKQATEPGAVQALGSRPAAFVQCATCHSTDPGRNGVGPSLAGAFGAQAAHEPTYAYSDAMRGSGLTWDAATLDAYIADPRRLVPGTKMSFAGVRSPDDRAAIVAYLESL